MKAKDIKPVQEYAYRWRKHSEAQRVRVIEATTVKTSLRHTGPGWLVESLEGVGAREVGDLFKATGRQITAPWADHLVTEAAERAETDRRYAALNAAEERQRIAVKELQATYDRLSINRSAYTSQNLSAASLLELLQQVEASVQS